MILNLKFSAVVFFYLLCAYGNSLVLHCEHQDTYPSNQGEVIQGETAISTFLLTKFHKVCSKSCFSFRQKESEKHTSVLVKRRVHNQCLYSE